MSLVESLSPLQAYPQIAVRPKSSPGPQNWWFSFPTAGCATANGVIITSVTRYFQPLRSQSLRRHGWHGSPSARPSMLCYPSIISYQQGRKLLTASDLQVQVLSQVNRPRKYNVEYRSIGFGFGAVPAFRCIQCHVVTKWLGSVRHD